MHVSELTSHEREAWESAMKIVHEMTPDHQWALIEHAVAVSVRYAGDQRDDTLRSWARSLMATIRAARYPELRAAMGTRPGPRGRDRGKSVEEIVAAVRGG